MGTVRAQKINKAKAARDVYAANPNVPANRGDILGLAEDNLRLQAEIEEIKKLVADINALIRSGNAN